MSDKKITTESIYVIIAEVLTQGYIVELTDDKQVAEKSYQKLKTALDGFLDDLGEGLFDVINEFKPFMYQIHGDSNLFLIKNSIKINGNGMTNFALFKVDKNLFNIRLLVSELRNTSAFNWFNAKTINENEKSKKRLNEFFDVFEEMYDYEIILN